MPATTPIRVSESEREKFYAAARDAFLMRSLRTAGLDPNRGLQAAQAGGDFDAIKRCQHLVTTFQKPAAGHEDFRHVSMIDLARMFLEKAGDRIPAGMPGGAIAQRAIQMGRFVEINQWMQRDAGAFNTVGSFPNLMLDAANKTLLAGYDESPFTYTLWVRQAPSAADYKELNRVRFGEMPDPEAIPENAPYPEKQTSDAR